MQPNEDIQLLELAVFQIRTIAAQIPPEYTIVRSLIFDLCSRKALKHMWVHLTDEEMKSLVDDWHDIVKDILIDNRHES